MQAKKYSLKTPRKNSRRLVLPILLFIFLVLALGAGFYLSQTPQDVRQQASSPACTEEQVNVEFRKYTGKDEPGWKEGSKFAGKFKVGDRVDVNCFAKTGTALLSNGKFNVTLNGATISIPSAAQKSPQEIRGYKLEKPGKYKFTCSNSACRNSDEINVTGTAIASPSPSPSPTPTPSPSPSPTVSPTPSATPNASPSPTPTATTSPCGANASPADLNQDCKVDVLDYDIFLREFIRRLQLD